MTRPIFNAGFLGALAVGVFVVALGVARAADGAGGAARPHAVLAVAAVAATALGALPNIDACVARLDPQLDIGYDRIAARCPDLMRQLETGPWAPWLPREWKEAGNDLSAGSLKEFRALIDRESAARDSTSIETPDVRSLQPILSALAGSHNETGWSRFKSWLRSILERREESSAESWFSRMVSQVGIPQSVIRLITYAALACVVVMAGMIVFNEFRTAGLLSWRRGGDRQRRGQGADGAVGLSWSAIEQAPLRERPRLLLEAIIRRLSNRGFLPPAGALTVRELSGAARLPEAEDRSRLAELALAAEWVRFAAAGAQALDARAPGMEAAGAQSAGARADGLDQPIARGRELLSRLDAGTTDHRRAASADRDLHSSVSA